MSIADMDYAWCTSTPKRLVKEGDDPGGLKSVGTALDVLECFATDGELGVSDIARKLGVAKSTAHRMLSTLASRGLIEQDPASGGYRLGLHLFELGQLALYRHELRHAALPTLRQLAMTTRHTVNFAVPDAADVVFIERIEHPEAVRFLGHFGRRLPAHCTSSGKVIAAFNPEVADARFAAGFPPRVRGTVRSASDWQRVLDEVRAKGYAASHSESFDDASSVAVPVLRRRVAVASVSIFGPTEAIKPEIDRVVPLLKAAAARISEAR